MRYLLFFLLLTGLIVACQNESPATTTEEEPAAQADTLLPKYTTDTTRFDSDDPAIWINPENPANSLILGTDKDEDGALYVFNLQGKVIDSLVVRGLKRPNNVDIEYGLQRKDVEGSYDIAVVAERFTEKLRVFSLPDMKPIDEGGIPVFVDEQPEEFRAPMGIALYKEPTTGTIYAIVSRKNGPTDKYLWQYELFADANGLVRGKLIRQFGAFSGKGEIEAICIDDALGHIYYSDEGAGVRQYPALPATAEEDQELSLFGLENFKEDREGISLYPTSDSTGYLLVSDQQANQFHVYQREGTEHPLLAELNVSTNESDGSETINLPLGADFPKGIFVAMSDNKTFQIYDWRALEAEIMAQIAAKKE